MFGKAFKLFRIFGFEVKVDLSWFFIALIITWSFATFEFPVNYKGLGTGTYWAMGAVEAVLFFLSIVFHELSHSLVARRFGLEMTGITLFIFGGVSQMPHEPSSPKAEFWMAAAGPFSSLVLGVGFYSLGRFLEPRFPLAVAAVFIELGVLNGLLAGFNVIPAFPLDGGRILRSILWARNESIVKATRITARIGGGFGILLAVFGGFLFVFGFLFQGVWAFLIGMFLKGTADQSYRQLVVREALRSQKVRGLMTSNPVVVSPALPLRDLVERYIYRTHYKLYPVVDDGRLLGCVTIADVKAIPQEEWDELDVSRIAEPLTEKNSIDAGANAMEALERMQENQASRLVVTEFGTLAGVISLKDLMHHLAVKQELEGGR